MSLYAANPAVQGLKVVAVAVFALGMLGLRAQWRDELGRLGTGAALVLVLATVAGAVPYSVAEASLSPALAPAVAEAQLEATYAGHVWIGILASVAMPLILISVVALGVVVLRRRLVPRWVRACSLAAILVGIGAFVVGELAGLPVPHPPAWIFLGLAAYGTPLRREAEARTTPGRRSRALAHGS